MGNKALRTRLASLLKEKKCNVRLYTSAKKPAYKKLRAHVLYDMILHLENIGVGTQIYDYGVNQTVARPLVFETIEPLSVKINKHIETLNRRNYTKKKKKPSRLRGHKRVIHDDTVIRYLRGRILYKADQVQYESGYMSCGCGSYDCLAGDNRRLRTKEEIVSHFLQDLYSIWGLSYLAKDYFKCLSAGIDIIDDNGFLIKNYRDVVSALNRVNKSQ